MRPAAGWWTSAAPGSTTSTASISRAAQLDGTLELALIAGYVPVLGDTLNILSAAGGVGGTFASLIQPATMPAGLAFDVIYNPTLVQLAVINAPAPLVGDYNLNGVVDAADYTVWRDSLGQVGVDLAADGDADGTVDDDDYGLWKGNFGMMAGSGALCSVDQRGARAGHVGAGGFGPGSGVRSSADRRGLTT